MADMQYGSYTVFTTPASGDYMLIKDVSETDPNEKLKLVTLQNLLLLSAPTVNAGFSNFSPADATSYYFGPWDSLTPNTTANARRKYFLRSGTISAASIYMTGAAGASSETSTMSFRLNNTTDTTLSSAIACNSFPVRYLVTGLSIAVVNTDYFEIKWVTPTWATNPTAIYCDVQLLMGL